jgi:hypothetical protein
MDPDHSNPEPLKRSPLAAIAAERNRPTPPILYKYLSQARINVLEALKIRFTQPASFNDPFDSHPPASFTHFTGRRLLSLEEAKAFGLTEEQWVSYESLDVVGGYRSQRQTHGLGILSLSECRDHLLMWSHYADSHRGFAIGLDSTHPFLAGGDQGVMPEEHPGLMVAPFAMEAMGPAVHPVTYMKERPPGFPAPGNRISMVDCVSKAADWSYEREWRAFRSLSRIRCLDIVTDEPLVPKPGFLPHPTGIEDQFGLEVILFDLLPEAIEEVVIGLKMARADRVRIANILVCNPNLQHVRVMVSEYAPHAFGLAFRQVDPKSLIDRADVPEAVQWNDDDWQSEADAEADVREALSRVETPALQRLWVLLEGDRREVAEYRLKRAALGTTPPIPLPRFLTSIPRVVILRELEEALFERLESDVSLEIDALCALVDRLERTQRFMDPATVRRLASSLERLGAKFEQPAPDKLRELVTRVQKVK